MTETTNELFLIEKCQKSDPEKKWCALISCGHFFGTKEELQTEVDQLNQWSEKFIYRVARFVRVEE